MPPLRISAETAQKLAKLLNVPLEHLMHMPPHVLTAKLQELARAEAGGAGEGAKETGPDAGGSSGKADPP